jgi:hypothetical protein
MDNVGALPDQSGNSGKYLTTDGTDASWATVSGGGGTTDHGELDGLSDDDHTQYHNDARATTWLSGKSIETLSDVNTMSPSDGQVLTWDNSNSRWDAADASGSSGGMSDLVDDTTPQLGGDLDLNGKYIQMTFGDSGISASGFVVEGTLGSNSMSPPKLLYYNGDDEEWIMARADSEHLAVGLQLTAGIIGDTVKILLFGYVYSMSLYFEDNNAPVYLSGLGGSPTQTPPSGSGDYVQVIGVSLSPFSMIFNPSFNITVV